MYIYRCLIRTMYHVSRIAWYIYINFNLYPFLRIIHIIYIYIYKTTRTSLCLMIVCLLSLVSYTDYYVVLSICFCDRVLLKMLSTLGYYNTVKI